MKHQVPPRPWPNTCWNIQESSSWCVEKTKAFEYYTLLSSLLHHPPTLTLHSWKLRLQSTHDPDPPSKTWPQGHLPYGWASQCPDQWVLTHCCWLGPVWATQFLSRFFSFYFCTWNTAFTKAHFSFYVLFSISSLHCLLTSHSKWIKNQFRNWSILRSSDENAAWEVNLLQVDPGSHFPREPWPPS